MKIEGSALDQPVSMRRDGNVAIITIDNPPVNALRHGVRAGIKDCVIAARDDASVEAIVLPGAGRTFVAGADITEFGKPPQPPGLMEVISIIDEVKKPTIAAVHGTPLGGGLELTMGCHFRVAAAGTRLGLPEIKLGLIPGAGGTQRLPRLVGIEQALPMILAGGRVRPQGARRETPADARQGPRREAEGYPRQSGEIRRDRRAARKENARP